MDVGADEFEQSLPLLQELVAGADFVGKVPGVAGPVRDSLGTGVWCLCTVWLSRPEELRERPRKDRRLPFPLGQGGFKQSNPQLWTAVSGTTYSVSVFHDCVQLLTSWGICSVKGGALLCA